MNEMQKLGCDPDHNIYDTVIRLSCMLGEVKEGVRLWNEIRFCHCEYYPSLFQNEEK